MIPDLVRYLVASAIIGLSGVGVVRLLRVPVPPSTSVLLGPVFGQALWATMIGLGVAVPWRVSTFAVPLWIVTLAFAMAGLMAVRSMRAARAGQEGERTWQLVVLACSVPIAVMGPYFWHGLADYAGSGLPDGWSYVAYGQYVWDYPRGTEGGLAPLYQYASTLSASAHVSSSALRLLAMLRPRGDSEAGWGLVQGVGLFAYASSVAAAAISAKLPRWAAALAVIVAVMSGWMLNVLWANNLDNLLALAYAPALAVFAADPRIDIAGWWLGGVILGVGLLHTYAELGIPVIACATLMAVVTLWGRPERRWSVGGIAAAVVLFVVAMPPARDLAHFVRGQLTAAHGPARPGDGLFTGLTTLRHVVAGWWGLGSEHAYEGFLAARTVFGVGLLGLMSLGAALFARQGRRAWLLWLLFPVVLAPWFAGVERYGYGAYKTILMGWWIEALLVVAALAAVTASRAPRMVVIAAWVIMAALPLSASYRLLAAPTSKTFRMPRPASLAVFRQVREIDQFTSREPLVIAIDDEEAAEWAVYYLRDRAARLYTRDRYLAPKSAVLDRSQPIDQQSVRWVLTDVAFSAAPSDWSVRWRGGPYVLWATPPGAGAVFAH